jgi:hypothetical protein
MVLCCAWHFAFLMCLVLCFLVFGTLGAHVLSVWCSWHFIFLYLALLALCFFVFSILSTLFLYGWCLALFQHFASWCLVLLILCFSVISAIGALLFSTWHSWHSTFLHLASFAFLELGFAWSNKLLLDFDSQLCLVLDVTSTT